ncbi:helix-turn-helix domain-containing protein [Brevundimonas sp.]|uniref:helix-turn-helix domain-containing protein n=1 Tax=Brevundimonas sp. TaxID=1871086 RepID=UPI00351615D1
MTRLTAPSCRAARALLGWSMRDLREKAGVALATVQAIEAGGDFRASTGDRIVDAFAAHGVEILNGDAPGARMKAGSYTLKG